MCRATSPASSSRPSGLCPSSNSRALASSATSICDTSRASTTKTSCAGVRSRRAGRSEAGAGGRHLASMFLSPAWLIALILQRQGWSPQQFTDPVVASIKRLCAWAPVTKLPAMHWNDTARSPAPSVRPCWRSKPRDIKRQLLGGYTPPDWRSDVWLLTDREQGSADRGGTTRPLCRSPAREQRRRLPLEHGGAEERRLRGAAQ